MAFKKVFTSLGPLMVDTVTGAVLFELASGSDMTALMNRINPPVTTPVDAASTHGSDAWVEDFEIPANCNYAEISFDKKAYAVPGMTTIDPTKDGAPYYPGIRYPFQCGGSYNRIFVKNADAGQNVTPECTFYPTE